MESPIASTFKEMDPFAKRKIGRTDIEVTQLGLGGATLGDPDEIISEAQAEATLDAAYDEGIRFFDTAPWYGNTKSEHRVGHYLRQRPRKSYRLATKVGRIYSRPLNPNTFEFPRWKGGLDFELRFDYTRDGVLRSYEQSLQRLGAAGFAHKTSIRRRAYSQSEVQNPVRLSIVEIRTYLDSKDASRCAPPSLPIDRIFLGAAAGNDQRGAHSSYCRTREPYRKIVCLHRRLHLKWPLLALRI